MVDPKFRELGPLETLQFRADDDWTANDLSTALSGLDGVYLSILLTRKLALEAQRTAERVAENFDRARREVEGAPEEIWAYEWTRLVRRLGPGALQMFPNLGGPAIVTGGDSSSFRAIIDLCLSDPSTFVVSGEELRIQRIEMASPGSFSLKGLGEPLRELRELIKDLWYRNSQERQRGQLELVKEKLHLVSQYRLSEPQIQELAVVVLKEASAVRPLVEAGKLSLSDAEPQVRPKSGKAAITKRRRRRGDGA